MAEPIRFSEARETTSAQRREMRQTQQAADPWGVWAGGVEARLAAMERRVMLYLGSENDSVLAVALGQQADDIENNVESAIKTAAEALREEQEVALAITRDELNGRIDQKLFGGSMDVDVEEMRRALYDLKKDVEKNAATTSALLDQLAMRIDATDKRRRGDRNTAHREHVEMAEKVAAMLGTMTSTMDAKIAKLAEGLESLERRTAEAFNGR